MRKAIRLLIAPLVSVLIFLGTGEAALRLIYRDAGRTTLAGPGDQDFEYLYVQGEQRGRFDTGPRKSGVPRLLAVGDSVTWGQGVRDWRDVWPEQLIQALIRSKGAHELAVLAAPGRGVAEHFVELQRWGAAIQPDTLIYQWYVNDLEIGDQRPRNERVWQRWALHRPLRRSSYLYYVLDRQLAALLPQPDRSYVSYILEDVLPGTIEWTEFERAFHSFATRAAELAPTRIMVLYPQVPFRAPYPLQAVHDRMRTLASAHTLTIPPTAWVRSAGTLEPRANASGGDALRITAGTTGTVFETRDYYIGQRSNVDVNISVSAESAAGEAVLGAVELIDGETLTVVAHADIAVDRARTGWQQLPVHLKLDAKPGRSVRFRVTASGRSGFALASLEVPVDYGWTVIDLTEPLNTFNTHASIFDAHPNERAHGVIAEHVFAALERMTHAH